MKPKFEKRQIIALADLLRAVRPVDPGPMYDQWFNMSNAIKGMIQDDNPNFKPDKFKEAINK